MLNEEVRYARREVNGGGRANRPSGVPGRDRHVIGLGARGDGYVEVLEGVAAGEEVVTAATFLIDAESNLKAALQAFTQPEAAK